MLDLKKYNDLVREVLMSVASRNPGVDVEKELGLLGISIIENNSQAAEADSMWLSDSVSQSNPERFLNCKIPLPYNGEYYPQCCSGIKKNHGLFTQCRTIPKNGALLCSKCEYYTKDNTHTPANGTIQMRRACGIFEYVAPNGKHPVLYSTVMKSLNLTKEEVITAAAKRNMEIHPVHFLE
jgi:hypothetical protein